MMKSTLAKASPLDSVTLEVIQRRLVSIADEMQMVQMRSAFSMIVKEGGDASTALFDAEGETVAQALAVPMHLGSLAVMIPAIMSKYPVGDMRDGDVFIANDPYGGGTHLPDITVMLPVFHDGDVVALSCSMAHMQDIGAITPGVPAASTSIFQEGLNIPPLRLYRAGCPDDTIHSIIRNNVRVPHNVLGDLDAQVAAVRVGRQRFLELVEEYGEGVILSAMERLADYAEELTRQEIMKMPDGTYTFEDFMDNDGVDLDRRISLRVAVTVEGYELTVDFSESSPQVKGPYNIPPSGAYTTAAYALRAVMESDIPTNAGFFRPITVVTPPEGTVVNPCSPAPVGARAATAARMADTILGAMAEALPGRVIAASGGEPLQVYFGGVDPAVDREYVGNVAARSGLGARPTKDGVDVICTDIANRYSVPAEAVELDFPLRIVHYGLRQDSGGAGKFRGGLGLHQVIELVRGKDVSVTFRGERHFVAPWGLFGGLPGAKARAFILRKNGAREDIPSKRDFTMDAGDQLHLFTPGGGGYGDPLERDPGLVLQDVRDNRVSAQRAEEDYGVVLDPQSLEVGLAATDGVRRERRRSRGPITWVHDRGSAA